MRLGCFTGVFLIFLAVAVMGFFMLPLMFEGNDSVMSIMAAAMCAPNETFTTDFRTERYIGRVVRGGQVYCISPEGAETNVTERSLFYAAIGFIVPFLVGLLLIMRTARTSLQVTSNQHPFIQSSGTMPINRRTYQLDANITDVNTLLQQFDVASSQSRQSEHGDQRSQGGKSLTEQLQDLQAAYDSQLITKEEYDRLRQQIIDNASRSL